MPEQIGLPRVGRLYGACSVFGTGAFLQRSGGIVSVVRTGPGVYVMTLDPGADLLEHVYLGQVHGGVNFFTINVTSETNIIIDGFFAANFFFGFAIFTNRIEDA